MSGIDELVKEMSATRKALALYFRKLAAMEEKIDRFTAVEEQRRQDEQARRRERSW